MAKTRKTVARRTPARKTTALARRKVAAPAKRKKTTALALRPKVEVLERDRVVNEGFNIGELGRVELPLTDAERKMMLAPVDVADIEIKPTGQPYCPHPVYTRRLNGIFGIGRWMLVPVSKPALTPGSTPGSQTVTTKFVLYIKGVPAAIADGEQEYHETNRDQTYGDALEATYASGLRRTCKRLGMSLELWTRDFLDDYVAQHCVRVPCNTARRGEAPRIKWQWRRKNAAKFWNEVDARDLDRHAGEQPQRRSEPERSEPARDRAAWNDGGDARLISDKQRQRLWVIIRNSGRDEQNEVKPWLERRFGYTTTKAVTRGNYEWICKCIESDGTLPEKGQ